MVSTYDTTITSLIINYNATSDFCQHGMHDTTYDTTIGTSLIAAIMRKLSLASDSSLAL